MRSVSVMAIGMVLVLSAVSAVSVAEAVVYIPVPTISMGASGSIVPRKLSRSRPSPAALELSIRSDSTDGTGTPAIAEIRIELSRHVSFETKGLPSCTEARLLSSYSRYGCLGGLVGTGTVTSEVTLRRDEAPVPVDGKLRAYYAEQGGRRLILAQVTSAHPPLTYVIPFTIQRRPGSYRAALVVPKRRMTGMRGICAKGHPECFGTPYTLEGVYSHISDFQMTLDRRFSVEGKPGSFVRADCPVAKPRRETVFLLLVVRLGYPAGEWFSSAVNQRCEALDTGIFP